MSTLTPEEIHAQMTDLIAKTFLEHCERPKATAEELLQIVKDVTIKKLQEGWPDDLDFPEIEATIDEDRKVTISFPLEQHQVDRLLEEGWFLQYDITIEPEFKINKIVMVAPWEVKGEGLQNGLRKRVGISSQHDEQAL
jgi:hypothetical protein